MHAQQLGTGRQQVFLRRCLLRRQSSGRRCRLETRAFFWQAKPKVEEAPKPNPTKFTRSDVKRIKQHGPTLDDVTNTVRVEGLPSEGEEGVNTFNFVPPEVLGKVYTVPDIEPKWNKLPERPLMELQHGLMQRNWTHPLFNANSEPWKVEIWRDQGRFIAPAFSGYRAVVTQADGSQFFVKMPTAGAPTNLFDHVAGGTMGAIYKQMPSYEGPKGLDDRGYNQVFEQLFQAYEERVPDKALRQMALRGNVSRDRLKTYDCPADRLLQVEYRWTPPEPTVTGIVATLPDKLQVAFALSFVGICVVFSLFRPKKKGPTDLVEALEFAQSKAKSRKDGTTGVTLADVAGLDAVKEDFRELITFLKDPDCFKSTGVKPPKGVLLEGPPGTGKTLIAKAIAGEANVGFYQMAGSEFVQAIVGVGAARVRDLFKRARAYSSPCIIFVDEIDALGIKRAEAGIKTNEEREQTLNQLLTEMDGFNPTSGVVFIAATNRADLLDPALMRAGRFDRKIALQRPDADARLAILEVHAKKHEIADDVDLYQLALDLPGLVGADLANVLNEAALAAVRAGAEQIHEEHILVAKDRVLQGVRKPALSTTTPLGKSIMYAFAVHEGGRALLASDLRAKDRHCIEPIEKVSILQRGSHITRLLFQRGTDTEYLIVTRAQMMTRLRVALAGHASEDALGLDVSTYSAKDFVKAQEIAERLVQNYGMSELGVTTFAKPFFAGSSYREGKSDVNDLFEEQQLLRTSTPGLFQPNSQMLSKLQDAQNKIIEDTYQEVLQRLITLRPALEKVAAELIEHKELDGSQVMKIYRSSLAGGEATSV